MKLTITQNVSYNGKIHKRGQTVEFDEATAKRLQDEGKAAKAEAPKKEAKSDTSKK